MRLRFWTIAVLVLMAPATHALADAFTGQVSIPSAPALTLQLDVDDQTGLVDITMTGPSTGWFSIGFGTTTSTGAYAIVADATSGILEQKLGMFDPGATLVASVTVLMNSVSGSTRTVRLQRSIVGMGPDYYTFPASAGAIDLIWAHNAAQAWPSLHIQRGTSLIVLEAVPTPTVPLIPALLLLPLAVLLVGASLALARRSP